MSVSIDCFGYVCYVVLLDIVLLICIVLVFFFKQKTAYEMLRSLVGSEMCIRDREEGERRED